MTLAASRVLQKAADLSAHALSTRSLFTSADSRDSPIPRHVELRKSEAAQRLERVRLRFGAELRRPNVALREALQASE